MTKTKEKISRYQHGEFIIDIERSSDKCPKNYYEAWIRHSAYGNAYLMFGLAATSEKDFASIVEANLDEYIKIIFRDLEV